MDAKELKELIDLMNNNELLELEVVEEGRKIRLKKMYDGGTKIVPMPMGAPSNGGDAPAPAAAEAASDAPKADESAGRTVIKSPMVGTFYRAPSPESAPYVEVGDEVKDESVVCVLEAMKVFNEIKAEVEGKIVEILVENGESVEYGQALFALESA